MKKSLKANFTAAMLFMLYPIVILYFDCQHPERWDKDAMHDPRIGIPVIATTWLVILLVFGRLWHRYRTFKRKVELDGLQIYIRNMGEAGNFKEADVARRQYAELVSRSVWRDPSDKRWSWSEDERSNT